MKYRTRISAFAIAMAALVAPVAVLAADAQAPAHTVVADSPVVKAQSGGIVIDIPGESTRHVVVYGLTGQVVKQIDLAPGTTNIDLPAGIYIVRVDRQSFKVVVK